MNNCVVKFYILNLLLWLNFDLFCLLFYRDDIVIFNYICSYLWQQIRSTDHTVHSVVKGKHGLHSNGRLLLFNNHLLYLISLSTFLPFFSTQLNNTVIWFWGFIFWKVTCINSIMEGKIPLKYIVFKFFSQHLYATKKPLIHIKQI